MEKDKARAERDRDKEIIYSSVRRMTADKKREQAQLEEDRKKEERFLREREKERERERESSRRDAEAV